MDYRKVSDQQTKETQEEQKKGTDTAEDILDLILSGEISDPAPETVKQAILEKYGKPVKYAAESEDVSEVHENLAYNLEKRYTIEDYYKLPDDVRAELVDGEFFVMEAPSIVHQRIITELWRQIDGFIRTRDGDCIAIVSPVDVRLDRDEYTMVQPDVIIVCDRDQIDPRRIEGAPDFVCEVVSPSTASRDYVKKAEKYRAAGVREYWIIDPLRMTLTTYDFASGEEPRNQDLRGKAGVKIYHEELLIDLDEFVKMVGPYTEFEWGAPVGRERWDI